jgi:UDP-N-acetylmuramoyl-L-alanine---L-glutamate ligase
VLFVAISIESLRVSRTAIWGYGREGQAALLALRSRFPEKRLALLLSPEEYAAWDFSGDQNLEFYTDEVSSGLLAQFGTVIKSPGITPYSTMCDWARFRGTRFISGSTLWFGEHPTARTICITGTKGKSTVSAMVAHLLRAAQQCTALVGNIGVPLLEVLDPNPEPDYWVIEMSSYQCADFAGIPAISCVLNLYPEHLPWHGTLERYYADKLKLLANGNAEITILNAGDPTLMALAPPIERGYYFNTRNAWHCREGSICFGEQRVLELRDTRLSGQHNGDNICAALTIVAACGFDAIKLARELVHFHPLPHRMQPLGVHGGVEYIDDSIATTPHATVAALRALNQSERALTVLVGGFDRGLDWDCFVDQVQVQSPHMVIASGANADRIQATLERRMRLRETPHEGTPEPGTVAFLRCADLAEACAQAQRLTPRNGMVLLSPGAPSFDAFASYAERGQAFAQHCGFDLSPQSIAGLGIR